MAAVNQVNVLGNVTRDPEIRYLQNGTAVCELGVAINEKTKNGRGEWVDSPVFIEATLWARTAEIAGEYLRKGDPVFISGRLKLDRWEKDGQKYSKLKVIGERLQLLGGKRDGGGHGHGSSNGSSRGEMQDEPSAYDGPDDESIPF